MVEITNTSGGTLRHRGLGQTFEPGDTGDVSEAVATRLVDRHGFERAGDSNPSESNAPAPPFDPNEFNVDELHDELTDDRTDDEREALVTAEREGKNRDSAIEVLKP